MSTILKHRVIVSLNEKDIKDLERVRGKVPVSAYLRELLRKNIASVDRKRIASKKS